MRLLCNRNYEQTTVISGILKTAFLILFRPGLNSILAVVLPFAFHLKMVKNIWQTI